MGWAEADEKWERKRKRGERKRGRWARNGGGNKHRGLPAETEMDVACAYDATSFPCLANPSSMTMPGFLNRRWLPRKIYNI